MVTGNYRVNGIDLTGLILMDMGPCTGNGAKATLPNDKTHRKFKFEQVKAARAIGVPKHFYELTIADNHISLFLTKQEES